MGRHMEEQQRMDMDEALMRMIVNSHSLNQEMQEA